MKPRIVIDTNVLIAALRFRNGASYQVIKSVGQGQFDFVLSVPLVLEYEDVAKRISRSIGLRHSDIDDILDYLCQSGEHREIFFLWRPFLKDSKDDLVLEVAVESQSDFVVTHNIRDFWGIGKFGLEAIRPGAFLRELENPS